MGLPLFSASMRMGDLQLLRAEYRKLPPALAKKHIRSALRKTVEPFLPEFRAAAPVRTGGLKRSPITVAGFDRVSGDWTARVGYGMSRKKPGYAALLVNNGTKPRKTKTGRNRGRCPAAHFADSMLSSVRSRGLSNLETFLYAALEKATNELPRYLAARVR
jgi:hypothetical protein